MTTEPMPLAQGLCAMQVDDLAAIEVGPGCTRIDLPSGNRVRVWIVDMAPGAQWPHMDQHDAQGEEVFVVDGELIEGEQRYGAGHFLSFAPHSRHRPRTEIGVRLFGFNLRG